jgi:hypothetical protein
MSRVQSRDIELITEVYDAYLVNRSDRAIARVVFRAGNRFYSRSGTVRREIRDLPPKSHVPLPMVDYCEPGPSVDDLLEVHWQDGGVEVGLTWNRRERETGESLGTQAEVAVTDLGD